MYHSIVASALSIKPTKWDKAQNADKLEAFIREAARERPDVIVALEGFLEGYVVMEVVRDPSKAEAMHALAEPLDGPYIRRFRSTARVDIPAWPASTVANEMERAYLAGQDAEMLRRHRHMMEESKREGAAERATAG